MLHKREASEKKGGVRAYLKAILVELNKGLQPVRVGNDVIVGDIRMPKSTFYELIDLLEEVGLIYKEDGKYYWRWKKEYQEFKTLEEYKVRLEHSKELFKECYIPPFSSELIPPRFEDENLLQHLKTGYPDIYEERNKCYSSYCEKVESIALKVKHGEPLKGWCNLCPKITIGR